MSSRSCSVFAVLVAAVLLLGGSGLVWKEDLLLRKGQQLPSPNMEQQLDELLERVKDLQARQAVAAVTTSRVVADAVVAPVLVPGKPTNIADGCYHVYLDVGASIGNQVRKLFEPELFPFKRVGNLTAGIGSQIEVYENMFGANQTRWRHDVCAFMFEPNPLHAPRLQALETCYGNRGWRTKVFSVAASNTDSDVLHFVIRLGSEQETRFNYWGAKVVDNPEAYRSDPKNRVVSVPSMDVASFIMNTIATRFVPPPPFPQAPKPRVVMKLDIETSERLVLPRMLGLGAFCVVDFIIPEMHTRMMTPRTADFDFVREVVPFIELVRRANKSGCAMPSLRTLDDETYGTDTRIPHGCEAAFANVAKDAQGFRDAVSNSRKEPIVTLSPSS